jgi:membrane protein implicated in regulation of membrane protease activity
MLPGTVVYVFAGGALVSGKGDIKKTIMYLAIAGVFFVLVSLIPSLIKKRYRETVED